MKVVILAGGFGTRISEESHLKPKPMIEIGGKPILWHIMKEYAHYGFDEFIICCGYKQYVGDETFMLTYGDGVCDVDINKLLEFHRSHGKIATMTAVSVGQRYRYILCQQSVMFCLWVSEFRYKRFVSEDMDMSEMRSRT